MFLGSSITHGFSIPAQDAFTYALERRLNEERPNPGFCVMNFAQPGFTSQQKLALGSVEIPRYHPALVLWEGWNEFGNFVLIGDAAYELRRQVRRSDGLPGLRWVPDGLNHVLFERSRFYELMTLAFGQKDPKGNEIEITEAQARLERLVALTHSFGARLGIYICPWLNRTFREAEDPSLSPSMGLEFAQSRGIPHVVLAHELRDQDYLTLRADECCHFSSAGHRALVPIFERFVLDVLDGKAASR